MPPFSANGGRDWILEVQSSPGKRTINHTNGQGRRKRPLNYAAVGRKKGRMGSDLFDMKRDKGSPVVEEGCKGGV